jgi:hypothetical protein
VKVHPDPQVRGTYAVRFTDQNEEIGMVDLLFITAYEQEHGNRRHGQRRSWSARWRRWSTRPGRRRSGGLQFFT